MDCVGGLVQKRTMIYCDKRGVDVIRLNRNRGCSSMKLQAIKITLTTYPAKERHASSDLEDSIITLKAQPAGRGNCSGRYGTGTIINTFGK